MQKDEKKLLINTLDKMIDGLKEMKSKARKIKPGKYTTTEHDFILRETELSSMNLESLYERTFYGYAPQK